MDVETFYEAVHEDAPLLVTRPNNREYFGGLFSKAGEQGCGCFSRLKPKRPQPAGAGAACTRGGAAALRLASPAIRFADCTRPTCFGPAEIDKLLRDTGLQYQFNVDVTSFSASDRKRLTLNYNGEEAPEEEAGELHGWVVASQLVEQLQGRLDAAKRMAPSKRHRAACAPKGGAFPAPVILVLKRLYQPLHVPTPHITAPEPATCSPRDGGCGRGVAPLQGGLLRARAAPAGAVGCLACCRSVCALHPYVCLPDACLLWATVQ